MRIPLHTNHEGSEQKAQAKVIERHLLSAKKGDWHAKNELVRAFSPLIRSLAEKRSSDSHRINEYVESGKAGLMTAVKKYKPGLPTEKLQIFVLNYIEQGMDRMEKGGGFFSRLFGKR